MQPYLGPAAPPLDQRRADHVHLIEALEPSLLEESDDIL